MSSEAVAGIIPDWHVGDRMRKALEVSGVTVAQAADYLGVHRNTVGAWLNHRNPPSRQTLRLVSLMTGVALEWLETGSAPVDNPPRPTEASTPPGTRTLNPLVPINRVVNHRLRVSPHDHCHEPIAA